MIILDTNVISELIRPEPSTAVAGYFKRLNREDWYITAITAAELRSGCALLPDGKKRDGLTQRVEAMLAGAFFNRILAFDAEASRTYADVAVQWRAAGRSISYFDALIAAITRSKGATLATRNTKDFVFCQILLVDPWTEGLPK